MPTVFRVFVEKKPGFDVEARRLERELREVLGIAGLARLRLVNRYDVEGVSKDVFRACVPVVFSEPPADVASPELSAGPDDAVFAVEYLPGQFDQRADSASECIQLVTQGARPDVRSATVYVLSGDLSPADVDAVKRYVINPVEAREAALDPRDTLAMAVERPAPVEVLTGFRDLDAAGLARFIEARGLAMDVADLAFFQRHFRDEERRDPTITEVRVIDTYWSDHCRHTTFSTELTDVAIDDETVHAAFERYLAMRRDLGRDDRPVTLMDMGTIGAKLLKARGVMTGVDESDEVNACTVRVPVDIDGEEREWLFLFKNETHNHPTEIEPFGGAATCVGGAIRDPLSGRSYVYQAMRVTGAADPRTPVADTLPGKLPQRTIVTEAAAGYSSYGNQIGLATGQVSEIYHPGYVAKRMEVGAVVGAAPAENVRREVPAPGDKVVLLGGRTGRDGIGGATGSSKAQSAASVEECGAEVQKGNAPVERKLQRLFRRGEACRLIKRCNDFGAGGVSVAIGELADGVAVSLDAVPKKYDGLDGTELAIAESQERMACVLAAADVEEFLGYAREENLEATVVAEVTEEPRVRMTWEGREIVSLSRALLASNGARRRQRVHVAAPAGSAALDAPAAPAAPAAPVAPAAPAAPAALAAPAIPAAPADPAGSAALATPVAPADPAAPATPAALAAPAIPAAPADPAAPAAALPAWDGDTLAARLRALAADLNVASSKGLGERFDSTIGAATVLMPFGGKRQLTPPMAMVAKLPADGETNTASAMAWGFNPYLSSVDQFSGAYLAVVESVAKLVATGFERSRAYLSLQEYFGAPRTDPDRWGRPVASVLGALMAQVDLGVGAIGGKDSMSGSFEDLDVPPTLISFAVACGRADRAVSPELKAAGHRVVEVAPRAYRGVVPDAAGLLEALDAVEALTASGAALAVATPGYGGKAEALFKMCVGNGFGVALDPACDAAALFRPAYGSFLVELADGAEPPAETDALAVRPFAVTTAAYELAVPADAPAYAGETVDLADVQEAWEGALEGVFPYRTADAEVESREVPAVRWDARSPLAYCGTVARPRVVVPVFPGTNCEYDTARAFERAGAAVRALVVNNLTPGAVAESAAALAQAVRKSQIVMIPGGFSGGDEPDGSAKLIAALFRAPEVADAVRDLLQNRDGLMLGICNGFQALVKLGLVPFGDIIDRDDSCPTLTFNTIGRHQSRLVRTRVASTLSPWLSRCAVGDIHTVAISHGEGRFMGPAALIDRMAADGRVATQYCDESGAPSMALSANPNGSMLAIEGATSPDGRVLGKMGHTERAGKGLYRNVPGLSLQPLFEGGVDYFRS